MGLYRYIAAERGKPPREMLIEADSEKEACGKLRGRGLVPVRFCGEGEAVKKRLSLKRPPKVNVFDFTRQLSPLLDSSIPLEKALAIIAESSVEPAQREFVNSLRQGLHEGKRFSELVRGHGTLFPGYYANLIESGEETGCLPEVTRELHKFMGESKELKDFILSSSIYPLAILSVVFVVTVLLFTVFVPRFARIFADMGRELPPTIALLTGVGSFASWAWWLIPLALWLAWKGAVKALGPQEWKKRVSRFLLKLPLLGRILVDLEMCKYLRTMAILLANHVEIIHSVRISGHIIANPIVAEAFSGIDRKLRGGAKLSAALQENPYVPAGTVPMLRVGEETGDVGAMLTKISEHLENDTRLRIKRLLNLFEPAVIIFLALVVLLVVVSIFVAMMEINSISQGGV